MTCEDVREHLSAYCDGDVASSHRDEIERHLEGCVDCRAELAALHDLIRRARALGRAVEPERDLWPRIEGRLAPRAESGRATSWWRLPVVRLAAAAALIAALALLVARAPWEPYASPPADEAPSVAAVAEGSRSVLALASERARAEDGLLQVREDLLRAIATRRPGMDPATRELVDRNLEIIDRAIGELSRALDRYPDNLELGLLLGATYQHEVELLKQINRL